MENKRKNPGSGFPFKRELIALAVILAILGVLFAAVRVVQSRVGTGASQPVTASQTERRTTLPREAVDPSEEAVPASGKVVYLTFDDAPTENTGALLDALDDSGVKATFFVIHTSDNCEEKIREIYARGHEIGLLSYSNKYEVYRSQEAYFEDLGKISDCVFNATGVRSKLLRFQGGSGNTISRKYRSGIMSALTQAVTEKGYVYFDWTWDAENASGAGKNADTITRQSTAPIGKDEQIILLMHDSFNKTATAEALPDVIRAYRQAGYRFGVLSEESFVYHQKVKN